MKNIMKTCALLGTLAAATYSRAQEIQLSTTYGQAAITNPALLCADGTNKVTMGYHTYYGSLSNPWREYAGTVEFMGKGGKGAFGASVMRSEANSNMVSMNGMNLMYGIHLQLNKKSYMRVGFQGGMRTKAFNTSPAVFEDMIDPYNGVRYATSESLDATTRNYFTAGAGVAFNTENLFLSLGLLNLNRPNTAFNNSGGVENKENMRIRFNAGYRIATKGNADRGISQIIPNLHYLMAGPVSEIGGGLALQNNSFMFSAGYYTYSYRASNVITGIGFTSGNIKLGYNVGMNLGSDAKQGGMSHELCASLILFRPDKPAPAKAMGLPMF